MVRAVLAGLRLTGSKRDERSKKARARTAFRAAVESMEGRQLLTLSPVHYPLPVAHSYPTTMTAGPDGNFYFVDPGGSKVGVLDPTTHAVSEFDITPVAHPDPEGITVGPDNQIWFTLKGDGRLAQIDTKFHVVEQFGTGYTGSAPEQITGGPQGKLWFTDPGTNAIESLDPSSGHVFDQFTIPTANSGAWGITADSANGKIWFTEKDANKIGVLDVSTKTITEYSLPNPGAQPEGIVVGSDHAIWFAESNAGAIGRFDTTTHTFIAFTTSSPNSQPTNLTLDGNGTIWFTEGDGHFAKLDKTTHAISEIAASSSSSQPTGLAFAPDGSLWISESSDASFGRFDPTATTFSSFRIPNVTTGMVGPVVQDTNGLIWFAYQGDDALGSYDPVTASFHYYELGLPASQGNITGLTLDPHGKLWFVSSARVSGLSNAVKIGTMDPVSHAYSWINVPGSFSATGNIAAASNGVLYFIEGDLGVIRSYDPATQTFGQTTVGAPTSDLANLTIGPDGNVWFVLSGDNKIGVLDRNTLHTTLYDAPTAKANLLRITTGPDGNLYVTENQTHKVGIFDPTSKKWQELSLNGNAFPGAIGVGPDYDVWFDEGGAGIGWYDPRTGTLKESALDPGINVSGLTAGPLGSVFFTSSNDAGANDLYSIPRPFWQTISTTTAVVASPPTSSPGDSVTFTATVSSPGISNLSGGTVHFFDQTTSKDLGFAAVDNGVAAITVSNLASGTHTIVATYVPLSFPPLAAEFGGSSGQATEKVGGVTAVATTTTVAGDSSQATVGQVVTFTATVLPNTGTATPTGSVQFFDSTTNTNLGSPVVLNDGGAVYQTSSLTVGSHKIVANYLPALGFQASSGSTTETIVSAPPTQIPTTTTLKASSPGVVVGQSVTFTATVSPNSGTATPTGSVEFFDNTTHTDLGVVTLSGGVASLAVSNLGVGGHSIAANYLAQKPFLSSSAQTTETVKTATLTPTAITLFGSKPTAVVGQPFMFASIVSALTGSGVPGGTVTFTVDGVTKTPVPLALFRGADAATIGCVFTTAGKHVISAQYNGGGNFSSSPVATMTVTANDPPINTDGPRVVSIVRYGYHAMPTVLVLGFNEALDPTSARNTNNYVIVSPSGQTVPVVSVDYTAGSKYVIIHPITQINLHWTYTLIVNGHAPGGLSDTTGTLLDGAGNGKPGSDYTTYLDASILVITDPNAPGAAAARALINQARAARGLPPI